MEDENINKTPETSPEVIIPEVAATEPAVTEAPVAVEGGKRKAKKLNKKFIAILIVIMIAVLAYSAYKQGKFGNSGEGQVKGVATMSNEEAAAIINDNLMNEGQTVSVVSVNQENGMFRIQFNYNGNEYPFYLTEDRKLFFLESYNIADIQAMKNEEEGAATGEAAKSDKPVVELFVMSHCPYGTQIEKGILPVIKTLGDKIDFKLKFCDYTMHGQKEVQEELNQYCIMQNQPEKLTSYLECFLGDETSSSKCMAQVGIDSAKISSCAASTDKEYKISESAGDDSTPSFPLFQSDVDKYKVTGSPSLVVNGTVVSSGRDSASLLKTICSGFENAPEECSAALDSASPAAGFGYDGTGSATDASCGS